MMIPGGIELAVLMGNTILGGLLKLWANRQDLEERRNAQALEIATARSGEVRAAREFVPEKETGFHWTRRSIALIGVVAILVWPKIVPVFWPDVPVVIGYSQIVPKLFRSADAEVIHWAIAEGVVITPLDTMVIMAILGLFMGSEIVKPRRF